MITDSNETAMIWGRNLFQGLGSIGVDGVGISSGQLQTHTTMSNHPPPPPFCEQLAPLPEAQYTVNYVIGLAAIMASEGHQKLGGALTPRWARTIGKWLQH